MPLCLDRVLTPARVTPGILGQCTRVDADLLGNEGDHRCRERLTRKDRPTEMAQKAELNGEAETVMRSTLGLDQIQLGTVERAVPDQALLVRRHVDKSGPLMSFEQGAARHAQSPGSCLR
jgi:hypothetical protein